MKILLFVSYYSSSFKENKKSKSDSQKLEVTKQSENIFEMRKSLSDFFQNDSEILKKIFKYEPLGLNFLKAQLKKEKIKYKKDVLLKFLDDQVSIFYYFTMLKINF